MIHTPHTRKSNYKGVVKYYPVVRWLLNGEKCEYFINIPFDSLKMARKEAVKHISNL